MIKEWLYRLLGVRPVEHYNVVRLAWKAAGYERDVAARLLTGKENYRERMEAFQEILDKEARAKPMFEGPAEEWRKAFVAYQKKQEAEATNG